MMNQSKKTTSLSTTRLSPLAKPFFTINNRSSSTNHSNTDDPFSSLLDSFRSSNLGSKDDNKVSTLTTQTHEKSLLEQHPSLDFQKNGDFDRLNDDGSHFDIVHPTYSPNVTTAWKQGVDFHQSLFGIGNDVGGSVHEDGGMLQQGKRDVDGLNPCLAVSDDIFKTSTGTIGGKDILPNSIGSTHASDESSFLMSNCKLAPLNLSTTDMSSAKKTCQVQTSNNSGDSDSDVDSPCWKGTIALCPTPSETSGSIKFHRVEKAAEKHNSLNPLAPQFFPGIGYIKDDFLPSISSASVATNSVSGEDILMKTVMVESPVELNKGIELQHSSDIYGRKKTFSVLDDKKCSSVNTVLNSHCMTIQSSSKLDCPASKGMLATIVDDDVVKGTKDSRASESISAVFPANGHSSMTTSTISSSRVGVDTDLFKILEGVLKSLIKSPKPDSQIIVSGMHVLSELLVQTCVDSVNSFDERDHDMIEQIINNLNYICSKRYGQMIPADSANWLDRSSELPKVCMNSCLISNKQCVHIAA
ncbi:hypothetical protein RIF29_40380 [Crotalaria pallida]|uniref:Uncharacterized protein n=1 Tax=Crotalaria pallida TaxID=3830 RepID=A0AAN9HQK9_CROPI